MVMTTAQLHTIKPEFRYYLGSNPAHNMSEICDGEEF